MPEPAYIRQRIEARIGQGEFLANLLHVAAKHSSDVQGQFVSRLSAVALTVRDLFERNGFISALAYHPGTFWPSVKGKSLAFVDGGVANIDMPSAAPIGIRVGSYVVKPGSETDDREKFNIELSLVDDLYSERGVLFEDDFLDVAKLRDAARMISEVAAGYRLAKAVGIDRPDMILLHGPLINPVAPYGLEDFPPFGIEACRSFMADETWTGQDQERHFIAHYLDLLKRLRSSQVSVAGVVERSIGRDPVVLRRILHRLQDDHLLKRNDAKEILDEVITYGLNDSALFDVVLQECEYITPIAVPRQGPESKWPEDWKLWIREYPDAFTTYLKPSELVTPFRVEAFDNITNFREVLDLILHTSRLLPSYGFPVGLDIVDKFAKVPAWMSRSVKGQHQVVLLQKALASGDPRVITYAKRVLAAKGRDWLFRPPT